MACQPKLLMKRNGKSVSAAFLKTIQQLPVKTAAGRANSQIIFPKWTFSLT